MNVRFRGDVLKAYLEVDQENRSCGRMCLYLDGVGWVEFTGVVLNDGFVLPAPFGCECIVSDISGRHWGLADYEIVFASSYSGEGTFYAKSARDVEAI